jgi:DnaJ-domain-containing protein 1
MSRFVETILGIGIGFGFGLGVIWGFNSALGEEQVMTFYVIFFAAFAVIAGIVTKNLLVLLICFLVLPLCVSGAGGLEEAHVSQFIESCLLSVPYAGIGGIAGYGIEHRAQERRRRIEEKRNEEQRRREEEQAKARLEQEREEIINLIHQTEDIIQKAVCDATNTENSLWLSALLIIQQDFRNLCQAFEDGGLSHTDAKARFLDFREQADLLSIPPPKEETTEESKKEPTYYEVIGVDPNASQEQIKKAYRDKLKQYHPDIFMNQPEWVREQAEKMSKKLNEAYEVLSDPNRRREYDTGS